MPTETKVEIKTNTEQRASFIRERATNMASAKRDYSGNWTAFEKVWKHFEEKKEGKDAWRSTLPDTWLPATIRVAQAAFDESMIEPVFSRHEDEDSLKAKDNRDLYVDNAKKGNLERELHFARLDAFKLGNGFLKTIYFEDIRNVFDIDRFDPDKNEFTYKKREIKKFDDPKTIRVSPHMMLVDEMATQDANSMRDLIELEILDYSVAKRKYGHLVSNWDEKVKSFGALDILAQAQGQKTATTSGDIKRDKSVKPFRFFAPVELNDNNVVMWHYWSINQGVRGTDTYELLANGFPIVVDTSKKPASIPYTHKELPYTHIPFAPWSGDEFWAAGIMDIGIARSKSIKKFFEMMHDRQKVSLFSPVFADISVDINQEFLALSPLSIIPTRGGVASQFQIAGISDADLSILSRDEEALKRAVGIDERVLGLSPESVRLTATEVSFLREAALKRLKDFFFLYKNSLLREVMLKTSLFDQYYASPLKREPHLKNDGMKALAVKAKEFKVRIDNNVYTSKKVYAEMFAGELDVDIDMKALIPLTQAQQATRWSQIIRDSIPLIQSGVKLDLEKMTGKYFDSFDINIETLRPEISGESVIAAEGEHRFFANENTSDEALELLPDGTPLELLTPEHIKRHKELLQSDTDISEKEKLNLITHITKDIMNLRKQEVKREQPNPQLVSQIGGLQGIPSQVTGGQGVAAPQLPELQKASGTALVQ